MLVVYSPSLVTGPECKGLSSDSNIGILGAVN